MKNKFLFLLSILSFAFILQSFELPKNILKKVTKEVKSVYEIENFSLEQILISEELNNQLKTKIEKDNLFKILNDTILIGYAFVDQAPSKTDEFDYLVLFDTDMIIKKSKVLVYREDYGAEIGSKRWLKQFIGLDSHSEIEYGNEIVPISGATISAYSMTVAINNLLKTLVVLQKKNIL